MFIKTLGKIYNLNLYLCCIVFLFATLTHSSISATKINSEVIVELSFDEHNTISPWQENLQNKKTRAIYLGDGKFLFYFHLPATWLRNVVIQRRGVSEITATYVAHDELLGLVIAHVDYDGIRRLKKAGLKKTAISNTKISDIIGKKLLLNVGLNSNEFHQIYMSDFGITSIPDLISLPTINFSSSIAHVQSGNLVWHKDKIFGFVREYDSVSKTGKILSSSLISNFVKHADKRIKTPFISWPVNYKFGLKTGLSLSGFRTRSIKGPAARKYYGLKKGEGGALVDWVSPSLRGFSGIREGDLLLAINGNRLLEDGTLISYFGKLSPELYSSFIQGIPVAPNYKYSILVQREHKRYTIKHQSFKLESRSLRVPRFLKKPSYLIQGGIVLQELSGHYLEKNKNVPHYFFDLYNQRKLVEPAALRRVVIVSQILPLKINIGYDVNHQQLLSIDGVIVKDLNHANKLMQENIQQQRDLVMGLYDGTKLILDVKQLPLAAIELQKKHGLPFLQKNIAP